MLFQNGRRGGLIERVQRLISPRKQQLRGQRRDRWRAVKVGDAAGVVDPDRVREHVLADRLEDGRKRVALVGKDGQFVDPLAECLVVGPRVGTVGRCERVDETVACPVDRVLVGGVSGRVAEKGVRGGRRRRLVGCRTGPADQSVARHTGASARS